jgi:hypothetical protein
VWEAPNEDKMTRLAGGAPFMGRIHDFFGRRFRFGYRSRGFGQQTPAVRQLLFARPVGEQTVVPDSDKRSREYM